VVNKYIIYNMSTDLVPALLNVNMRNSSSDYVVWKLIPLTLNIFKNGLDNYWTASIFVEIWLIFDFLRWRPSAILDLFYVYLDHP